MRRIDKDPRKYEYVRQEDYCCVDATLEMILKRHGIRDYDQVQIACELGLTVPEDCESCPPCAKKVPRNIGVLFGTQLSKIPGGLNTFFLRHGLPFTEFYFPISKISSPEKLKLILKTYEDEDVIACFQVVVNGEKYGHVCAVDEVKDDSVVLVDTDGDGWKLLEFTYEELFEAMKNHGDKNRGGLWIIRKLHMF